ncbi:MAG: multicopper oxidase domain-containing protein [Ilumatobacteraceae bacterium]
MTEENERSGMGRRRFFRYAGGVAGAVIGAGAVSRWAGPTLRPFAADHALAADITYPAPDMFLGGTDGWIGMPPTSAPIAPFFPDDLAPPPFNTYIFGFRNVTELTDVQRIGQKNHAQHNAPLFWVDEFDPASPKDFRVDITNLGLAQRPDLFDAHTLHWHGFRNVIPFFDGEPTGSVSVPAGSRFTYIYRPRDPGTYMYHCHVEDVEHVHMGMTGLVFVRPKQNGNTSYYPSGKYAYNDGDGSTGYDREFMMFLSEVWGEAHWADSHIQLPEWSDYHPDFSLLNGRSYPDTLAANTSYGAGTDLTTWTKPYMPAEVDGDGTLVPTAGSEHLQFQPLSSLITCNAAERVLLRFANLGFKEPSMTMAGITMKVVGRDATPMTGRDHNSDTSYETNTISVGAGESYDVIFVAPAFTGGTGSSGLGYDTYLLYNRDYTRDDNHNGRGGQTTEVHVYAAGALPVQTVPNT